jgi:hypothetical protein
MLDHVVLKTEILLYVHGKKRHTASHVPVNIVFSVFYFTDKKKYPIPPARV